MTRRPLQLCLVGPDEIGERAELVRLAQDLGLGERVEFVGPVYDYQDLLAYYRAADLFVLPSLQEGFPRVIYEAMTQGLPVIATAVGGIPEVVVEGESGLLVPPGSESALAQAIDRLLSDGELRRRVIRGGYAKVGPLLDKSAADQAVQLMASALGREAPARPGQAVLTE